MFRKCAMCGEPCERSRCEKCREYHNKKMRAYYHEHKMEYAERAKKFNAVHPDYQKQWRAAHKEKVAEYNRRYLHESI